MSFIRGLTVLGLYVPESLDEDGVNEVTYSVHVRQEQQDSAECKGHRRVGGV